ncbi:unnamed protein product [Plutella xylostella]|uniref:Sensory neuron membrane protein 2 n=1 Tax=Plutella xylostella TaxID=51655 RepID=A0A8S4GD38_PLUXY|nr:unnamed protein product [Plutella xylostella]
MLGFLKRNSRDFHNNTTKILLYNALVRSHLEFASAAWSPHYTVHSQRIESIQRAFTRYLAFTSTGISHRNTYDQRLNFFNMNTLHNRRSYLVLTYPHFLFAHPTYANMVVGMTPDLERHRIFLDLEPNSGYPVRGAKRAQLNVFFRRIPGVAATANFDNTLVPIFWLEEGITLPDNLIQEIKDRLLGPLELVAILLPTVIALSGAVMLIGAAMLFNARRPRARASPPPSPIPSPRRPPRAARSPSWSTPSRQTPLLTLPTMPMVTRKWK